MKKITIEVGEYGYLLESMIRIRIFADYVQKEKYSIDRFVCGRYLGFEVEEEHRDGTD